MNRTYCVGPGPAVCRQGEPAMCRHHLPRLGACLLLLLLAGGPAAADEGAAADEQVLRGAGVAVDGPGLLAFLRARTVDGADEARIRGLVRQLGDDSFRAREQASQRLAALGARARPFLRDATRDPDIEIVRRAEECLRQIERGVPAAVVACAVRALARHRPDGVTVALLAYLPSAEDEAVADQVRLALESLALADGKPDPALVAALKDPLPVRR